MSNTPITDESEYMLWTEENYGMGDEYAEHVVPSDIARSLECKKNKALDALKMVRDFSWVDGCSAQSLARGVWEIKDEIRALIDELE